MSGGFKYKQSQPATANAVHRAGNVDPTPVRRAKIAFVERKYWRKNFLAFSLEKVFEQVARKLDHARYETLVRKVPYGNAVQDILRNLLLFRMPEADIYHVTGQIHYMTLALPPDRTVLTIHDLAFLQDETMSRLRRFVVKKLFLDLPVKRARIVTTVSDATKKAVLANTDCDENKVRVIANPVQDHYSGERKPFNNECPTILQIGITQNKNISRLLTALQGIPCRLKIIGNMTRELESELDASGIDYLNALGLNDDQMRLAYEQADIVSFCSIYEGFGLPIIEGQAMCTPIVTSDLAPMKDVAGPGAALVDPFDIESIRGGLLRVIQDVEYREKLIDAGLENVKRFSSELIAGYYAQIYDEILDA